MLSRTALPTGRRRRSSSRPHQDAAAPHQGNHFRSDIEGLRAVAVGLVLADHIFAWPSGGFVGVDIFFVISGFLITGLLVRERVRTERISIRAFYVRRVRRLIPAALATLAATVLAARALFFNGRFQETLGDGVWAMFFSANINFARQGTDYFEQSAAPSPVQHFWSLAVEEQFYLLWPTLILLAFALPLVLTKRRGVYLLVTLGAVTTASFVWSIYATASSPATAYFSTFTRGWELGFGALIAVSAVKLHRLGAPLRAGMAWIGLVGVIASALLITARTPFPGVAAALPVVSAGLILAFGNAPGGPGSRWLLSSPPARYLGKISYSLYLWHWPTVVILSVAMGSDGLSFALTALAISLGLATASYYCIEQPVLHSNWLLREKKESSWQTSDVFRRARYVGLAASGTAVAACIAVTLVNPPGELSAAEIQALNSAVAARHSAADAAAKGDPLSQLEQDIQKALLATKWPADLNPGLDELAGYLPRQWSNGCLDVTAENVQKCLLGDPHAGKKAMLLGDSIAAAWLPGLRVGFEQRGWAVQPLTMAQCPNIMEVTLRDNQPNVACAEHRDWAIDYVRDQRPALVILSDSFLARLADEKIDRTTAWRNGLTTIVQQIKSSGAQVVILSAPPGSANLQTCATTVNNPTDCVQGPADWFQQQRAIEGQVSDATGVKFIDPEPWFCLNSRCPSFIGSSPVYGDGVHMTAEYSTRIGPDVVAAMLATEKPAPAK
jgi:peptidoglycan/LPS O-acetylase OafA/YrhL